MYQNLINIWRTGPPVTFSIMVVICVCSLVSLRNDRFFLKMLLHPVSIFKHRQYYRLVTSDLVHNDLTHLLMNEITLYGFCMSLEEYLRLHYHSGSWLFLIIYLASCLSGTIITALRHRKDFNYSSTGASGSIIGCMLSFMILQPNYIAFYLPLIGGLKNKYAVLIYILAWIIYQRRSGNLMVNHEVHFWGGVGGVIITLTLFGHYLL